MHGNGESHMSSSKFRIDYETGLLLTHGTGGKGRILEREGEEERERGREKDKSEKNEY